MERIIGETLSRRDIRLPKAQCSNRANIPDRAFCARQRCPNSNGRGPGRNEGRGRPTVPFCATLSRQNGAFHFHRNFYTAASVIKDRGEMYTVAVDIGGTFTDVVVIDDADGRTCRRQGADHARRPAARRLRRPGRCGTRGGRRRPHSCCARTGRMVHATTQSSNAVFAFAGARTAVLTTRGFGDTLMIMRATGRVAGLSVFERHHYRDDPEAAPAGRRARHLRGRRAHGLPGTGRAAARRGRRARRSPRRCATAATRRLPSRSCSRTRTPRTSSASARSSREELPDVYLSLSSEVAPVMGEYERSATALFNAYVGPVIEKLPAAGSTARSPRPG